MNETDPLVVGADGGLLVEQPEAFRLEACHFGADVGYLERDVVDALAPLREVLRDGTVGAGGLEELDLGLAGSEEERRDALLLDSLLLVGFGAEKPSVQFARRGEVGYGDAEVFESHGAQGGDRFVFTMCRAGRGLEASFGESRTVSTGMPMPNRPHKIVNDPVYGFIGIPRGIVLEVVDHPWFQRLRRIKQLSLTHYVYPGAQHTRFQHALGALHLMSEALDSLRTKGVEITDEEYEAAQLAIVLHDIGHGPFSHTLEGDIIDTDHEALTLCFMRALDKQMNGRLKTCIRVFTGEHPKPFLHQLVSGQLDIDRLDYLNRDTYFTGVSEGVIGSERIIKMLHVVDGRLVVEEKGVYSIEKFLIARRLMYWQVYLHKTVLAAELMLKEALRRLAEVIRAGAPVEGVSESLRFFLMHDVESCHFEDTQSGVLERFARLDDTDIVAALKGGISSPDKLLRYLCESLLDRRLYKLRFSGAPIPREEVEAKRALARQTFGVDLEQARHLVVVGRESNSAYVALKNEIDVLYKSGEVRPLSESVDFGVGSRRVEKSYLAFPDKLSEQTAPFATFT